MGNPAPVGRSEPAAAPNESVCPYSNQNSNPNANANQGQVIEEPPKVEPKSKPVSQGKYNRFIHLSLM